MHKLISGKVSILVLTAAFAVAALLFGASSEKAFADTGAIWTTTSVCGAPQDANHYVAGEHVYIHGSNFDANTLYAWDINTVPASTAVASGTHSTDGNGDVCFDAYTIGANDSGVYKATFGDKTDNYSVTAGTPSPTPTATPTTSPTATPTGTPTPTPTFNPCDGECEETPSPTPTPTTNDVCLNIDGIQTSLPEGLHFDNAGINCLSFSNPGAPESPSSPQGQVLGTSTMAATGSFLETLYLAIMGLGGAFTTKAVKGLKKAFKKA